MLRNVFLLVSFTILCLEGIYFFMMPGGGSNDGDGSSASASSEVSTQVAVEVGSLQPFQVKGDPHSILQRWRKWKRAFQLYVLGRGITNDSQKRGLLLHTAGLDIQEVYFTLVPDGAETNYAETFKVLDDYFIPKANVPFERHLFWQSIKIRVVRKRSINLFAGSDNQPLRVSLENGKMSTSEINSLTNVTRQNCVGKFWKKKAVLL